MKINAERKKEIIAAAVLFLFWCIGIFIANTSGNFPVNDDWSYSKTVKIFIETGNYELTGWAVVPMLTQILCGSLWCLIFGFSFEVLRFSTIVLSIVGLFFVYQIYNEATKKITPKLIAMSIIAFNPIFFLLSNTFMTDIPYFVFSVISIYLCIMYFQNKKPNYLFLAMLFSLGATFIRQIGILIPISFAITVFLDRKKTFSKRILPFFYVALILSLLVLFQNLIRTVAEFPFFQNERMNKLVSTIGLKNGYGFLFFIKNSFALLVYLGLFISPFLVYYYKDMIWVFSEKRRKKFFLLIVSLSVIITFYLVTIKKILPLREGVLFYYGLGPATLKDVDILGLPHINVIPQQVWIILTFVGIVSFILLFACLFKSIWNRYKSYQFEEPGILFMIINIVLMFITLSLMDFYERYLLLFIPLLLFVVLKLIGVNERKNNYLRAAAVFYLILIMTFSVLSTHDYFDWNRSRWKALDYLKKELKISESNIDGGFEFNGWNGCNINYKPKPPLSWWWVKNDDYIISFGYLQNYKVVKKYNYQSWLFISTGTIFVLKK
jgi:4-amino-4-deoxy-L-arabinose transferase-like glycosyltransferase